MCRTTNHRHLSYKDIYPYTKEDNKHQSILIYMGLLNRTIMKDCLVNIQYKQEKNYNVHIASVPCKSHVVLNRFNEEKYHNT